jgi:hypothetical protein
MARLLVPNANNLLLFAPSNVFLLFLMQRYDPQIISWNIRGLQPVRLAGG